MASINISDLRPKGSDLFCDSEGYMDDFGDNEFENIYGGFTPALILSAARLGYIGARSSQQCAIGIAGAIGGVGRLFKRN
ncbi:MAG: hypothetical protein RMX96_26550 [Nostoc sp. ChiSLP02]|nr:hypothetical protein [Nostoc sp. DedSLP05]MDZ8102330.1 hypothetical protein [Nostoc sp. DedSLP01]MDZ8188405.1 hypothetical protein [Nostoc sp. ChiSLP02]